MVKKGGRDQLGPLERLVKILAVLQDAGPAGVAQHKLITVAGFIGEAESRRRMLTREITNLRQAGWEIENVAPTGANARYVLHAPDVLLGVDLRPRYQAELARVVRLAALDELTAYVGTRRVMPDVRSVVRNPSYPSEDDQRLAICIGAAANRQRMTFMYKRRLRVVHPRVVHPGPSGWYLAGCEDGQKLEKCFAVSRIEIVAIDAPGTATVPVDVVRSSFDPATWDVDPPVDVVLESSPEFADQVAMTLRASDRAEFDGRVRMTVRVTNRAAFRRRLYGLSGAGGGAG